MLNVSAVDCAILQIARGHVTIRLHLWAHAYSKRCTRLLCVMGKCTIELLFNMLLPWVIVVCGWYVITSTKEDMVIASLSLSAFSALMLLVGWHGITTCNYQVIRTDHH